MASGAKIGRAEEFGASKRGSGITAIFAMVACGGAVLSGCAGLANTSNANPTPQAAAQLSLSSSALNFGNVLVNGSAMQAVTLKNSGTSDVQVTQIGVTGGAFSVSGMVAPVTISAGQSVALQATFAPKTAGAATGA